MSQTSVTRHYNIRKRNVISVEVKKPSQNTFAEDGKVNIESEKEEKNVKIRAPKSVKVNTKDASKKKPAPAKKGKKTTTVNDKKSDGNQSTIKTFFTKESDKPKNEKTKTTKAKNCTSCIRQDRISSPFRSTVEPPSQNLQQSPKRNHPSPSDEGTPPKKKHLEESESSATEIQAIDKPKVTSRRKLKLDSLANESIPDIHCPKAKLTSQENLRTPDKLDALVDQSRLILIHSSKRDELKKALQVFSDKTTKLKELQSNPYMINCIASSSKLHQKKKPLPTVAACERFNYLTQSDSLVLPLKYQELSEMFKSMDFIVAMRHNRKENILFDNVIEGVNKNIKRNFTEKHLGQIITVFPSAYILSREKASYICKKNSSSEYQLIIAPNFLNADKGSNKSAAFQHMDQSCLTSRINEFNRNLLELVKKHHQDFLTRINFVTVSKDSILRWHPKFAVDSVPDIPLAQLPELTEKKIYTAKDTLSKFKESFHNKTREALQSVAEETEKSDVTLKLKELNIPKPETSKELKGICLNLIEKIRGKESEKLLKTTIETPSETKRLAMLERVPKIVNILLHYFVSERKAALPLDTVVDKIIHSLESFLTQDEIKEHLKLIQENFPSWLKFIPISKGVYLTINKSINVNEMLDNAGLH